MPTTKRTDASWSDVKAKLIELDRSALLALVHDLYAAGKENQTFLHTRFGVGDDVLKPYQTTISRWLWPDTFRGQDTSVAKAKKGDCRLQEGRWPAAWLGGADGVFLRTGVGIRSRCRHG
jgi:hypothetical protein